MTKKKSIYQLSPCTLGGWAVNRLYDSAESASWGWGSGPHARSHVWVRLDHWPGSLIVEPNVRGREQVETTKGRGKNKIPVRPPWVKSGIAVKIWISYNEFKIDIYNCLNFLVNDQEKIYLSTYWFFHYSVFQFNYFLWQVFN